MCINIYVYVCVPLWRFYILRRVFIYICLYACILAPRIEIKKEEKQYAKEAADSVYVCIHSKQLYFAACEYMHICTLCACASFVYASLFYIVFSDLSVAGPPAKLKHITQRRKRKQP
ncbi:hypothetical protein, unlikely [Trypanosoma brucei gambiense DAL972]|uniref:Uncharacterized protein n=1 Tax=Trypanosoma brucei gambiense (strain MHOM/CI/86/DAL972) TaxID=679716 RepID=D0A0X2_TRYB9|nr:hypothetical protein, unlikely [Trypanosoma brucei gambiense DAL972]CBH16880.1 hypothetical protein, unlikely [Trypanosoma brucei gambiense DAL972]|eukprot:XP_011779144.1 hypothetical protein, unlikely [Trypanosoma brucei gambiense DAL972]